MDELAVLRIEDVAAGGLALAAETRGCAVRAAAEPAGAEEAACRNTRENQHKYRMSCVDDGYRFAYLLRG